MQRRALRTAGRRPAAPHATHASRPRLLARLRATEAPFALLVAPAGYGKTTVLREWTEHDERACAWVTLADADDDPARLRAAIARAIAAAGGQRDAGARPLVLVLDDAHALRTPQAAAALLALVEDLPAGSQVALAARREPALPVGRLRAHRRLLELRTADLAMDATEAAELLARAGLRLDRDAVELLVQRTEGWPACLYLAALCMREEPDPAAALARFGGDDRLVADYLRDELLAPLDPAQRRFLLRSSILEQLSGPLCDAVLGISGSGRMLARLADADVLLALDRTGERYRAHRLLAELLRAELQRTEPAAEGELRRRASAWHAARGDADGAIRHALAAGDVAHAIVRARAAQMGRDAAHAAALAARDGPGRALCCLLSGAAAQLAGEPARARPLLEQGVRRGALAAPLVQALCLTQLALLATDEGDWHGGALLSARAVAQIHAAGLAGAPPAALVFAVAAAVGARRGRVGDAERDAHQATQLLGELSGVAPWYEVETRIALARAALRLSDLAGARHRLAEAARLARRDPSARVLRVWLDELWAQADAAADSAIGGGWSLTTAELRVLQLLPTYLSYPDIARRLFVSPNTVKTHARAVYRKLDACSRAEAVGRARDAGLLDMTEAA